MIVSNQLKNLSLNVQKSLNGRHITLHNRGSKHAYVTLSLLPLDQRSKPLLQWGTFSEPEELILEPGGSKNVTLTFKVPPQAAPGFYSYELCMQSPSYPGEDIRRLQQLEVKFSTQAALSRIEPKLQLTPATSSEAPCLLKAGQTLTFNLTVENLSQRTDLFLLICTDLSPQWLTITYPESGKNRPNSHGLELNPQETGNIQLLVHPPKHALAGHYFPTLQLSSRNREGRALLNVIYFTLEANEEISVALAPKTLPIPNLGQTFNVTFSNEGNIQRQLTYKGWDAERLLSYRIQPTEMMLAPGEKKTAQMSVHPRRWQHRLWRLREREINFDLLIDNVSISSQSYEQLRTETLGQLALPQLMPTGTAVLKVQRRWLCLLLVLVASTGLLLTIWHFLFWRPHNRPKIANLSTAQETYQEGIDESIRLNFDIVNADQNVAAKWSLKDEQFSDVKPIVYDKLVIDKTCSPGQMESNPSILNTLLGAYRGFKSGSNEQSVLRCRGVAPNPLQSKAGTYSFKLEVLPASDHDVDKKTDKKRGSKVYDAAFLEGIVISPPALPQVNTISLGELEYRTSSISEPNGARLPVPVTFSWEVSNVENIEELQLVNISPRAFENTDPLSFSLKLEDYSSEEANDKAGEKNHKVLTDEYCTVTSGVLTCESVPIQTVTEVGEYTFSLNVIPKGDSSGEMIAKSTPTILVKPPIPQADFKLNGESVQTTPKHVFVVNPDRGSLEVSLSWEVENEETVEILPAPGLVEGKEIPYILSAAPGSEMITLRAVNEIGEEFVQSVVIEKIEYVPGTQAPLTDGGQPPAGVSPEAAAAAREAGNLPQIVPSVTVPELAPISTPPRAD